MAHCREFKPVVASQNVSHQEKQMKMMLKEDGNLGIRCHQLGHWVLWSCVGHSLSGLAKSSTQMTEKGFITNSPPQRNLRELHSSTQF